MPTPCLTLDAGVFRHWTGTWGGTQYTTRMDVPAGSTSWKITIDGPLVDAGHDITCFWVVKDAANITLSGGTGGVVLHWGSTSAFVNVAGFPIGASYILLGVSESSPPVGPKDISVHASVDFFGCNPYCAYGTEPIPGFTTLVIVDAALISLAVTALGAPWLAIILGAFAGATLETGLLCNGAPPTMPYVTSQTIADFGAGNATAIATMWKVFQAASWSSVCQCKAATGGGPAPVDYPPPLTLPPPSTPPPVILPPPPPLPTPPPIVCDSTNICGTLEAMRLMLVQLGAQMANVTTLTTLVQRQGVPFGYLAGGVHAGLSGNGQFAVSGILGLAVHFTTLPGTYPPHAGDPDTYHQIGKVSVGTADGWLRSWEPTHSPYMILEVSGAITLVGYAFPSGIVATITELRHEP